MKTSSKFLTKKNKTTQSNLFQKDKEKYDLIVFNHPFYSDHTYEQLLDIYSRKKKLKISRGKLIQNFFLQARNHLKENGKIIMPYFLPAGKINNPSIQAKKHGYEVQEKSEIQIKTGLQQGKAAIYEIQPKD